MGLFDLYGNKVKVPNYKTSFSLFESFSIIGDSFEANISNNIPISWVKILERISGAISYNFSAGGRSTKTWLEDNEHGLAKMLDSPPTNLYVICLGINDANQSIPIGTINDIESDNINSFYSYYGRIVRAIISHAPNSIIMLSTLARINTQYNPYSKAIRDIASYYDYGLLDLAKSELFTSSFFTGHQVSNHPRAVALSAMAEEYKYMVELELETNIAKYVNYNGRT